MFARWLFSLFVFTAGFAIACTPVSSASDIELPACCGGPGSDEWAFYRMENEEVVDHRLIRISQPCISRARPESSDGTRLDIIIVKYGDGLDLSAIPWFDVGTEWFSAELEGIGFIAAAKKAEGETWLFKIGDKYISKSVPASDAIHEISWQYSDGSRIMNEGSLSLGNGGKLTKKCVDQLGGESKVMYLGNAIALEEMSDEWIQIDWLRIEVPNGGGTFYLWPKIAGALVTVTFDERLYNFYVEASE